MFRKLLSRMFGIVFVASVCFVSVVTASAQDAALEIVCVISDNVKAVPANEWKVEIRFSHPVAFDRLPHFIHLKQNGLKEVLRIERLQTSQAEGEAAANVEKIVVFPERKLTGFVQNRIVIDSGLTDVTGSHVLAKDYIYPFISVDVFTIVSIEPSDTESIVKIQFSDWVAADKLRYTLQVTPPVSLKWYSSRVEKDNVLALAGDFARGTHYLISLPEDFKSNHDLPYTKTLSTFVMPDHRPQLKYTGDETIIERDSRQLLGVELINVDEVLVEGLRVPPLVLPAVSAMIAEKTAKDADQDRKADPQLLSITALQAELNEVYQEWLEKTAGVVELDVFKSEIQLERQLFFKKQDKNEWSTFSCPLSWRNNKERGGLELFQLVNNRGKGQTKARIFRITDMAITVKKTATSFLVWITSLKTGAPLGDISVLAYDNTMTVYYLGKTNKQGVLTVTPGKNFISVNLNDKKGPFADHPLNETPLTFIVAASESDCSYLELKADGFLQLKDIDHRQASGTSDQFLKGVVITERGVYRPGETVHIKAIIRQQQQGSVRLPEWKRCRLSVQDARDEEYYSEEFELSEFGTIHCNIPLNSYDPLGTYTISLEMTNKEEVIARRSFQVQELRPPRHFSEISFNRGARQRNDYVNLETREEYLDCRISGKYFAGGPVKHGQVRWKVYYTGTSFAQKKFSHYTFGYPGQAQKELLESGETLLDEKGEAAVRIPLSADVLAGMYGLEMTASVIDFDGRVASITETFQEAPQFLVGIQKHDLRINCDEEQRLTMIVLDEKQREVKSGTLTVECFQKGWSYTRKRNKYGDFYWENVHTWRRIYSQSLSIVNKKASFDFDFAWGGDYLIQATFRQGDKSYTSGTIFNVWGDYYGYDAESKYKDYENLRISTDKDIYEAGDTMAVSIKSRSMLSYALVTIEREDVLHYDVIARPTAPLELKVGPTYFPNIYISVIGTVGRADFPVYTGSYDQGAPSFAFGTRLVEARSNIHTLTLSINDGAEIAAVEPGTQMTLTFKSLSEQNQPVASELMVAVVDDAVLALTGYTTPDIHDALRFLGPLSVFTFDSRLELLKQTPFNQLFNQPLTGGGGSATVSDMPAHIRKDFNPVAYYNPALLTDENGLASVVFTLPDTMTRYRIFVIGCDKGSRFGTNQTNVRVSKDFYLEPGLPRFLRTGDELVAPISVFNKTAQTGLFDLEIITDQGLSLTGQKKSYALKEFDRLIVKLDGIARQQGATEITFKGTFAGKSDAVQVTLPIQPPYVMDLDYVTGSFKGRTEFKYALPAGTEAIPWQSLSDDDISFRLTFSGSPFLRLESGLNYLLNYPYGCVEQTSSITMPLAALRQIIGQGLVHSISLKETDVFIQAGVERLFTMQTGSGGFGYWPGDLNAHVWGSLYALTALIAAEKSGITLPQHRMDRAMEYLEDQIKQSGANQYTLKSFMAFLLAERGQLKPDIYEISARNFDKQPREAALFSLMAAFKTRLLTEADIRQRLATTLEAKPVNGGPQSFYTAYREEAIALLAASTIMPGSQVADHQAQKLLGGLSRSGIWTSTSDTGWSLLALARYFSDASFSEAVSQVTVFHNQQKLTSFDLDPKTYHVVTVPARPFLEKPELVFEVEPENTVLFQLEAKFPRLDYQKNGYSNGFEINKTIENTDGSTLIKLGDMVKVSLKIKVPHLVYRYVVLDDPLPAGLVAINSALKSEESTPDTTTAGEDYWWNYWDADGYYRFVPNYFEMKDDRILVFKNYCWNGDYVYTYYARAVCAGEFIMPSAKIHLMYDPKVIAYTPEQLITIKE